MKQVWGFARESAGVALYTLISGLSAILRQGSLAWFLGDSAQASEFFLALALSQIGAAMADAALLSLVVPWCSRARRIGGLGTSWACFVQLLGLSVVASGLMTIIEEIAASGLVRISAPGWSGLMWHGTAVMIRIMAPASVLVAMTYCVGQWLQTEMMFGAATTVFVGRNLVLATCAPFVRVFGVTMLAGVSVFAAGAQLVVLGIVYRKQLWGAYQAASGDPNARISVLTCFRQGGYGLVGFGAAQLVGLVERATASYLGIGAVAILNYGQALTGFLGNLGGAVVRVAFSRFARREGEIDDDPTSMGGQVKRTPELLYAVGASVLVASACWWLAPQVALDIYNHGHMGGAYAVAGFVKDSVLYCGAGIAGATMVRLLFVVQGWGAGIASIAGATIAIVFDVSMFRFWGIDALAWGAGLGQLGTLTVGGWYLLKSGYRPALASSVER